jgi:hypothetical protein
VITHVVIFWTDKPHGENRDKLLAGAREYLAPIPGVKEFRSGVPIPSPRGVVDDGFAVAISMSFETQDDADVYQAHPMHGQFIEECVKPHVKRLVVYDFG